MNIKSIVSDLSVVEDIEHITVQDIDKVVSALADQMAQEGKIADILIAHGLKRMKRVRYKRRKS